MGATLLKRSFNAIQLSVTLLKIRGCYERERMRASTKERGKRRINSSYKLLRISRCLWSLTFPSTITDAVVSSAYLQDYLSWGRRAEGLPLSAYGQGLWEQSPVLLAKHLLAPGCLMHFNGSKHKHTSAVRPAERAQTIGREIGAWCISCRLETGSGDFSGGSLPVKSMWSFWLPLGVRIHDPETRFHMNHGLSVTSIWDNYHVKWFSQRGK